MNVIEGLSSKTTLQHLLFLEGSSIVQACKELKVTPQQFSDWIKKRRPIPLERLIVLKKYFEIDVSYIVDEKNYAKNMSSLGRVELELLVMSRRLEQSESKEDKEEYQYLIDKLKKEKANQIRIARLAALINADNGKINSIIDRVIDRLEEKDFLAFEGLI